MPVVTCTFTPTQDNPAARPGAIPQLGIHRTLTAIGVTIGSLLAADLLYRWVEVPMIDVGAGLSPGVRNAPTGEPPSRCHETVMAKMCRAAW